MVDEHGIVPFYRIYENIILSCSSIVVAAHGRMGRGIVVVILIVIISIMDIDAGFLLFVSFLLIPASGMVFGLDMCWRQGVFLNFGTKDWKWNEMPDFQRSFIQL